MKHGFLRDKRDGSISTKRVIAFILVAYLGWMLFHNPSEHYTIQWLIIGILALCGISLGETIRVMKDTKEEERLRGPKKVTIHAPPNV